jgi:hypothetical protein
MRVVSAVEWRAPRRAQIPSVGMPAEPSLYDKGLCAAAQGRCRRSAARGEGREWKQRSERVKWEWTRKGRARIVWHVMAVSLSACMQGRSAGVDDIGVGTPRLHRSGVIVRVSEGVPLVVN